MRIKSSPGTLKQVFHTVLGTMKGQDALSLMNDVRIRIKENQRQFGKVDVLLKSLLEAATRPKLSMRSARVWKVKALVYFMSGEGIKHSEARVKAINTLKERAGGEEIITFLGLMNLFTYFLHHFADIDIPLYDVLKCTGFSRNKNRGA